MAVRYKRKAMTFVSSVGVAMSLGKTGVKEDSLGTRIAEEFPGGDGYAVGCASSCSCLTSPGALGLRPGRRAPLQPRLCRRMDFLLAPAISTQLHRSVAVLAEPDVTPARQRVRLL